MGSKGNVTIYPHLFYCHTFGPCVMTQLIRRVRTIWWYSASFLQKNAKFILTSFVAGFIMIFFFLSIYPSINSYLFRKKEKIGLIARVKLGSLPKIIISQISTPLVTITPQGEIVPVLANSWEIMPDKKTFRFHIKNGLKWSDGKEFKARDIKLQFSEGVKINVVDDLTIEFILDQSLEVFPVYLTQPVIRKCRDTQKKGVLSRQSICFQIETNFRIKSIVSTQPLMNCLLHINPVRLMNLRRLIGQLLIHLQRGVIPKLNGLLIIARS